MSKMRRFLSMTIALMVILSSGVVVFAQISDADGHWANKEITYMVNKGIINGYDDNTFRPDDNMTNAEFYKVINELAGYKEKVEVKFKDVKKTDWFYENVEKGLAAGYLEETELLNPNELITREEVARIVGYVYDLEPNAKYIRQFKDYADVSLKFRGYVGALKNKGYIQGYEDGTFRPKDNITRAEVVKMLYNIIIVEGNPEIKEPAKKDTTPSSSGGGYYSGGSSGGSRPSDPRITGIHADDKDRTVQMAVYGEYQLPETLKVTMSNNTTSNKAVIWAIQEENVSEDVYLVDNYTIIANKIGEYKLKGEVSGYSTIWNLIVGETIKVSSIEELNSAIATAQDGDIIELTTDMTGNVSLDKLISLDLNGKTIDGDVSINTGAVGIIELSEGSITGNLTVNTPEATVNNFVTVGGTIIIEDIAEGTWNENADGNDIVVDVKDEDKVVTLNIGAGAKVKKIRLDSKVTLTISDAAEVEEAIEINAPATVVAPKGIKLKIKKDIEITLKSDIDEEGEEVTGDGEEFEIGDDKEPEDPTGANVKTFEELKIAIEDEEITTINMMNDIDVTEKLNILSEKHINGNKKSLTANSPEGWDSFYVLHFYQTTGSIKDIKISGADAAIYVNGSQVELSGTIDVSGNEFGGIEVSKGSNVTREPTLIINGATLINKNEASNIPTIWEDQIGDKDSDERVEGYGEMKINYNQKSEDNIQRFYYLSDTFSAPNPVK